MSAEMHRSRPIAASHSTPVENGVKASCATMRERHGCRPPKKTRISSTFEMILKSAMSFVSWAWGSSLHLEAKPRFRLASPFELQIRETHPYYSALHAGAIHARAQRAQFAHVVFVASIDMVDIMNARFSFGGKTRDHERRSAAKIGRRDRCTLQS